jgi:hypothetical protein
MLCGSKGDALSLCTERREICRRPGDPEHGTKQEVVDPVSAGQVVVEQVGGGGGFRGGRSQRGRWRQRLEEGAEP